MTLFFQVDPEELTLDVDPHQIEQVLLNLCLNALHAVANEGEIELRAVRSSGHVVVEVRDTGCGIAAADLEHIFDPFFSTKGRGQGTGLGLSVTFGIVREHRGRIRAESHPGGATRFRVELPAADHAEAMA